MSSALSGSTPALVVAAPLRMEARALRRGAPELAVLRTGAGRERALRGAARLRAVEARSVAVAGLCGALAPELAPGDVVVASSLHCDDGERVALDCVALRAALAARGIPSRLGPLRSTDHVVRGAERVALNADGAMVADMESAWLARGARGRPLAVVRVVVDAPAHELLRPGILRNGLRALRRLREIAPALVDWASRPASLSPRAGAAPAAPAPR